MKGTKNGLYNPLHHTYFSIRWVFPQEGLNVYLDKRKAPLHLRVVPFNSKSQIGLRFT